MNIQITNGKALYEGLEIENFEECNILLGEPIAYCTYPLPEGWDVEIIKTCKYHGNKDACANEACWDLQECQKSPLVQTARLVRKEQPGAKDELRKEFDKMLKSEVERVSNTINPGPTLNDRVFDWFYSKLLTYQQEIAAQKQLTKDEVKRVSDIYQSVIDELKKKYESPS